MELDLKEIGQTLAVGALLGFGVWLMVVLFSRVWLVSWIHRYLFIPVQGLFHGKEVNVFMGAVFLALIFAFGITLEDLSKDIAAVRPPYLEWPYESWLPSDRQMRMDALFSRVSPPLGNTAWKQVDKAVPMYVTVKELTEQLVSENIQTLTSNRYGPPLTEQLKSRPITEPGTDPLHAERSYWISSTADRLADIASQTYYQAHNELYVSHPETQDELRRLETRMDFARALFFASITLLGVAVALTLVYLTDNGLGRLLAEAYESNLRRARAAGSSEKSTAPRFVRFLEKARYWVIFCLLAGIGGYGCYGVYTTIPEWNFKGFVGVFLYLGVLLGLIRFSKAYYRLKNDPDHWNAFAKNSAKRHEILRIAVLLAALLGFTKIGQMAFISESTSYNLRVFGYFQTLHSKATNEKPTARHPED